MKQLLSSFALRRVAPTGLRQRAAISLGLYGALLSACGQQVASAEQPPPGSSEPSSNTLEAQPAQALGADDLEPDDAELRRGYGVVDMRSNACVTRKDEKTFVGSACPPGFVIYGPYVAVPANADIEVAFDIKSNKRVEIYADIVSRMGTQTLAGLNRQTVEPGVDQKLGYRVHIFNADTNVESRIGMNADPGTEFEIANLTMTVR